MSDSKDFKYPSDHLSIYAELKNKTPNGKKVLIVENDGTATELFNIKYNGKWITTSLESGTVGTYVW